MIEENKDHKASLHAMPGSAARKYIMFTNLFEYSKKNYI